MENNDNKLALTGVTGFKSGGILVEYIASNQDKVKALFPGGIVVICRKTSKTGKIEKLLPGTIYKRGEFNDEMFLSDSLKGCDTLIHVAGIHRSRDMVAAAVGNHMRRLILVHTTSIYSKYKSAGVEYRRIDEYVEKQCKENNIALTILRPTMIYGNIYDMNVVKFISMVDIFPVMPIVNGARFELQPVHYKDLGKAYYDVLMNEKTCGHNYNLSGGEIIQLRDMLTVIGENLGKKVKFISCPYWIAYSGAWILYLVSFGRIDYREKVQRLCEPRVYSHQEATRDFGYEPRTFQEGVKNEVAEYLKKKV